MWRCGATGLSNDVDPSHDDLSDSALSGDLGAVWCDRCVVGKTPWSTESKMDPVILTAGLIILAVEIYIRLL
jgi:hypothetical protein